VITAPYRGLWWVLCDRAIDTELPKVISAINTRMVSFMAGTIAPTKRGIFTRASCQEGVACGGLGLPWRKRVGKRGRDGESSEGAVRSRPTR